MKRNSLLFLLITFSYQVTAQSGKTVLITYFSKTGHTKTMADEVARGVSSIHGIQVRSKPIDQTEKRDLIEADAIIIGTPVNNGNIAPEVMQFINQWPFENKVMKDKLGAVFVTAGGISAGEELAQVNLLHSMMVFGMVVLGGDDWTSSFGASAITEEVPFNTNQQKIDKQFLQKAYALGKRVGTWVHKIH